MTVEVVGAVVIVQVAGVEVTVVEVLEAVDVGGVSEVTYAVVMEKWEKQKKLRLS